MIKEFSLPSLNVVITLRQLDKNDEDSVIKYANSFDSIQTRLPNPFTALHFQELLSKYTENENNFAFAIQAGEEVIGIIQFTSVQDSNMYELKYWLGKPFWNKGITTKAVGEALGLFFTMASSKNVDGVRAFVTRNNASSGIVLMKNGFRETGRMPKEWIHPRSVNRVAQDLFIYTLLKDSYDAFCNTERSVVSWSKDLVSDVIVTAKHQSFHLRPIQVGDEERITELLQNKNVIEYLESPPYPYTKEDGAQFVKFCTTQRTKGGLDGYPPHLLFAIVVDGVFAGVIDVAKKSRLSNGYSFGYWLGEAYWGKGIVSTAVFQLSRHLFSIMPSLEVLFLIAHEDNIGSNAVAIKNNFQLDGVSRCRYRPIFQDKSGNTNMYSLTRADIHPFQDAQ